MKFTLVILSLLLAQWPHVARAQQSVSPAAATAIDRALAFLKQSQLATGDFPHGSSAGTTAVPSLAVMAFLSRGHMPGQGPYGATINSAIDLVLKSQILEGPKKGLLARDDGNLVMYEHGISTVMLTEAYGMVDDARRVRIDRALAARAPAHHRLPNRREIRP